MAVQPSAKRTDPSAPALIPMGHHANAAAIELKRPVTVIGSRSNARIHLISRSVSKAHALLVLSGSTAYIRDLASRTHVYVNGEQVRESELVDDDLIKIGSFTFKFSAGNRNFAHGQDPSPQPATLDVDGGEMPLPIDERVLLIGRRPTSDLVLIEDSVSTAHAVVFQLEGKRFIRDLGSRTGTFVNGSKVHQQQLDPGDEIRIGETSMRYVPSEQTVGADLNLDLDLNLEPTGEPALAGVPDVLTSESDHAEPEPALEPEPEPELEPEPALDLDSIPLELETPASEQEPETQPVSTDIADEVLGLSGDETEPAKTSSDIDTDADTQARATDAMELAEAPAASDAEDREQDDQLDELTGAPASAGGEPVLDELAPDEQVAPPDEPSQAPDDDDVADLAPRRGWRAQAAEPASEQQAPTPDATDQADDSVFRFSDPAAVETDSPAAADEQALVPAEELPLVEDEVTDLGLTSNLEDLVAPAPAVRQDELDAVDFSKLEQDQARDDEPALDEALDEEPRPRFEAPLLDLSLDTSTDTPASAGTAEPDEVDHDRPLIAQDALTLDDSVAQQAHEPEAREPQAAEPEAHQPDKPARRRRPHRGRPADVVAESPDSQDSPVSPASAGAESDEKAEPVAHDLSLDEPIEVVEKTEPTVESALALDDVGEPTLGEPVSAGGTELEPIEPLAQQTEDLTDTSFGRAVEDFTGEAAGPLVESPEAAQPEAARDDLAIIDEEPLALDAPVTEPAGEPTSAGPFPGSIDDLAFEEEPAVEPIGEVVVPAQFRADHADQADEHEEPEPEPDLSVLEQLALSPEAQASESDEALELAEDLEPDSRDATRRASSIEDEPTAPAEPEPQPAQLLDEPSTVSTPAPMPAGWGPNQDHFLGGSTSQLDIREPEAPVAPAGEPASAGGTPAQAPPTPPPPARERRRPTVIRNFGRDEARAARGEIAIPPFAGSTPGTRGQITTAFDGLAMPPVRETDVFAQPSPPADVFASKGALTPMDLVEPELDAMRPDAQGVEPDAPRPAPRRPRPTREPIAPAGPPASAGATLHQETDPRIPPTLPVPDELLRAAELRRRAKLRRIPFLLVLMIGLIIGATVAIWQLVPVQSMLEAAIAFKNFESLNHAQIQDLKRHQQALLIDDETRRMAIQKLEVSDPGTRHGFLATAIDYRRVAQQAQWPPSRTGMMVIPHHSDDRGDTARLRAIVQAMYDQNRPMLDAIVQARQNIAELESHLASSGYEVRDLRERIEKERAIGEQRPDVEQLQELETQLATAQKSYDERRRELKNAQDILHRLQQDAQAAPGEPASAGGNVSANAGEDEQLQKMRARHAQLSDQIASAREAQNQQAGEARAALDEAMKQFEQQLADAREGLQDNPQLLEYVAAAQKLQEDTRVLTDELIQRQQAMYAELLELKTRLNEAMEARRQELWQKDDELAELNKHLEITTRQYNAAVAQRLEKEAADLKIEFELVQNLIESRKELLGNDPLYTGLINDIQKMIDRRQSELAADRKRTDERLREQQEQFAKSQPAVAKLPQEQKELAEALETRVAAINDARTRYAQSIDTINARAEAALRKMQTEMASLASEIEARSTALAAADQQSAIEELAEQRQQQIAEQTRVVEALSSAEAEAAAALSAAEKALREMRATIAAADESGVRLVELSNRLSALEQERQQHQQQLELVMRRASSLAEPVEPLDSSVSELGREHDRRPLYAGAAAGGIFLIFSVLIVLTVTSAMREVPFAAALHVPQEDLPALPGDPASAGGAPLSPDESSASAQPSPEDDREPAVA